MSTDDKTRRDFAKRLPAETARTISDLAAAYGLTFNEVAFAALRRVGLSQRAAYRVIRPKVTDGSAEVGGTRLEKSLRKKGVDPEALPLEPVVSVLADLTAIRAMVDPSLDLALRGSDQINKTRGRYAGDSLVTVNLAGFTPASPAGDLPAAPAAQVLPAPFVVEVPPSPEG